MKTLGEKIPTQAWMPSKQIKLGSDELDKKSEWKSVGLQTTVSENEIQVFPCLHKKVCGNYVFWRIPTQKYTLSH